MKYLGRAALVAGALFIASSGVSSAQKYDHEEVTRKTFEVSNGSVLTLDADLGSITIEGGKGSRVEVIVTEGVNNVNRREADKLFDRYEVFFDERSRGVEIIGEYDKPRGRINWKKSLKVHYDITVPENTELDIKTAGGSIQVENIDGDVMLKTSGGSLQLADIEGRVVARTSGGSIKGRNFGDTADLHTSGGSITVEGADGSVKANTSGGSINMAAIDGTVDARTSGGTIKLKKITSTVNANTSGGSIVAEITGQPQDDMSLSTSGGSVTVYLNEDVEAEIDAKSSGGSVKTDFPVTIRGKVKRTELKGTINGGGPLLYLRTSGGSVKIREL